MNIHFHDLKTVQECPMYFYCYRETNRFQVKTNGEKVGENEFPVDELLQGTRLQNEFTISQNLYFRRDRCSKVKGTNV